MSNAHSDIHHPEPSDRKVLFSAIGWVGVILIFAVIVLIAFSGERGGTNSIEAGADARYQIKSEVFAAQNNLATHYQWTDQANNKVRVPLDRAKEITLAELQATNQQKLEGNSTE
ncbi:MAG: hypothetical protein E1N59_3265 [Puniceicoccaceae bacterium 5H]|nr:MAG: hypothetical protein E1N59_3265 [Puniceicoccaceae bacterium 5H]